MGQADSVRIEKYRLIRLNWMKGTFCGAITRDYEMLKSRAEIGQAITIIRSMKHNC